ncbi:neuronal acetylcholine receptor subunit alpha-7-like [Babylonia areolata]|uniref:neuronal acetylcholine receptor subunit alpha-7-like n=1 Tax=Babylonia areolata TaxID=304850 RepID=UPI003FD03ACD
MKGYDPLVRPVVNFSQPVYLRLSMGLKSFIELDMKKQTLVCFGWLGVVWHDHFLRWDLDQFPFHKVQLTPDMVWRPDLVIYNTVDDLDQLEDQKRKVIIESTGKVTWYPGGLFQTTCSIDIFHYPLDTQTCSVEISTWSSSNEDIKVFADPAFENTNSLETHPEWALVRKKAEYTYLSSINYWRVQFTFVLRRKVTFYILNMILPMLLLSLMNCLVFLLPEDSGEKMTVSVTMFLSFAVFLSLINTSLPQNSDTRRATAFRADKSSLGR